MGRACSGKWSERLEASRSKGIYSRRTEKKWENFLGWELEDGKDEFWRGSFKLSIPQEKEEVQIMGSWKPIKPEKPILARCHPIAVDGRGN